MSKKIMLLALGAASVMMLAVPAMASAITENHVTPLPVGEKHIDGVGSAVLSTASTKIECKGFTGKATFENTTTGTMELTFGPECKITEGAGTGSVCRNVTGSDSITTGTLPFHLATVAHTGGATGPGVLVTPGGSETFATFNCIVFGFPVQQVVKGNGVIGTITAPKCNEVSPTATVSFTGEKGVQTHKTLAGTDTEYSLKKGEDSAAQKAHGTITFGGDHTLVCT
jgi:hypothetical protein